MKMKKVNSLKQNPSWFGNMIKLSWIIAEIADSLLPSIIRTKPAISNHNKHYWAQQLLTVLLTQSANQKMLSVFSLSFDSICLESESTSWTSLFHIHAGASSNDTLSSAFQKALTQQIPNPLDPDVKWTVFTSVTSDRHNMPSYGSKPSQKPAKDHGQDHGSQKSQEEQKQRWFIWRDRNTQIINIWAKWFFLQPFSLNIHNQYFHANISSNDYL